MREKRTLYFLAVLFIIVGILLTLENLSILRNISQHWPLFLIIIGSGFVLLFIQGQKSDDTLIWLGTFIFLLGAFFYYLNFTSWKNLSTLWPIFLGLVGFSFLSIAIMKQNMFYVYFSVVFIGLFLILTTVFAISTSLWPISFVVFGLSLLVLEKLKKKI